MGSQRGLGRGAYLSPSVPSAGMVPVTLALNNTLFLIRETEYLPWEAALNSLSYFKLMLDRSSTYAPMQVRRGVAGRAPGSTVRKLVELLPVVARASRPPLLCGYGLGRAVRAGGTGEVSPLRRARGGPRLPAEGAVLEVSTFRKSPCAWGQDACPCSATCPRVTLCTLLTPLTPL